MSIIKKYMQDDKERLLAISALLLAYLSNIIAFAVNGRNSVNSDMASEMILADLLNKEGGLLSKSWIYSTELRVLHLQPVNRIALKLFSDWHLARTFTLAIAVAILLGSYLYFAYTFSLGNAGIWTAVAFVLPFSYDYMYYVLYNGNYLPYVAITFLAIGIAERRERGVFAFLSGLILAFLTGLGGCVRRLFVISPTALQCFFLSCLI